MKPRLRTQLRPAFWQRQALPAAALLIIFAALSIADGMKAQESLYDPKDPILQIKSAQFSATVLEKKKGFFVEFYSSWCGHCVHFAPTWKKFSLLVASWHPIVELVAVNCALEENTGFCRDNEVDSFPTIKYFKHNSVSLKDGKEVDEVLKGKEDDDWRSSPESLAKTLADILVLDWKSQVPADWPKLDISEPPIQASTYPSGAEYLALIFVAESETDPSRILGVQAILDTVSMKNVHVVILTKTHDYAGFFPPTVPFPSLLIMKKEHGKDSPVFVSKGAMSKKDITKQVMSLSDPTKLLTKGQLVEQHDKPPEDSVLSPIQSSVDATIRYQVHMTDLISGLSYMLRQEIPLKKDIADEQLTALKNFMTLMTKYYPGSPPIRRLLYRLNEFIGSKTDISGAEFDVALEKFNVDLGRPLPKNTTWVACKGSEMKYRGYPCSLWTIFHALTVAAYKKDGKGSEFNAVDVLQTIHGYIKNFFGCSHCVENFGRAAVKIPQQVHQPQDVILWLWRSHNRANKFTESDPKFPKTQFPPSELCPRCHVTDSSGKDTWNEAEVLDFMIQFYSDVKTEDLGANYRVVSFDSSGKKVTKDRKLDINPKFGRLGQNVADEERKLMEMESERLNASGKAAWEAEDEPIGALHWTGLDKSLCLTLWAITTLVCLGFLAYFKCRKSRKQHYGYGKFKV